MTNIFIHDVRTSDREFLFKLMNDPALMERLHQIPSTEDDWYEAIRLWLQDDDEKGYIIFHSEEPIGWFAINGLQSPDKRAYIKIAVLLSAYQSQGIGFYVLTQLLHQLKASDYATVRLFVDCDNTLALKCYQKCGFQIISTIEQEWPDGSIIEQYEMEHQL